jgi:hypothetical protein
LPSEIEQLVRDIDEDPDLSRIDYTPAVWRLIEIGEPSLSAVFPLMLAEDATRRLHAETVIGVVSMRHFGFRPLYGWPDESQRERWLVFWRDIGGLDWQGSKESRTESMRKWGAWYRTLRAETVPATH